MFTWFSTPESAKVVQQQTTLGTVNSKTTAGGKSVVPASKTQKVEALPNNTKPSRIVLALPYNNNNAPSGTSNSVKDNNNNNGATTTQTNLLSTAKCIKNHDQWELSKNYVKNDLVTFHGELFLCRVAETGVTMNNPSRATEYWIKVSSNASTCTDYLGAKGIWVPNCEYKKNNVVLYSNSIQVKKMPYLCIVEKSRAETFYENDWVCLGYTPPPVLPSSPPLLPVRETDVEETHSSHLVRIEQLEKELLDYKSALEELSSLILNSPSQYLVKYCNSESMEPLHIELVPCSQLVTLYLRTMSHVKKYDKIFTAQIFIDQCKQTQTYVVMDHMYTLLRNKLEGDNDSLYTYDIEIGKASKERSWCELIINYHNNTHITVTCTPKYLLPTITQLTMQGQCLSFRSCA